MENGNQISEVGLGYGEWESEISEAGLGYGEWE